jgi:hypothetical protein
VALGYRPAKDGGAGAWTGRISNGKRSHDQRGIGTADDYLPADNDTIFSFDQALAELIARCEGRERAALAIPKPSRTVEEAMLAYESKLRFDRRNLGNANTVLGHLPKTLRELSLAAITAEELLNWQSDLQARRKLTDSTMDRLVGSLRAAFNWAADNDPQVKANRGAWLKGTKLYPKAERHRAIYLTAADVQAIIREAALHSREYLTLVQMAATFGTRVSQLARIVVNQLQGNRIQIPGDDKGQGKKRESQWFAITSSELLRNLQWLAAGQAPGTILLRDENGKPWRWKNPKTNEWEGKRHQIIFRKIRAKLGLPTEELDNGKVRESSLTLLRNVSIQRMIDDRRTMKETADLHFTSEAEIARHYHRGVPHDKPVFFDCTPKYRAVDKPASRKAA